MQIFKLSVCHFLFFALITFLAACNPLGSTKVAANLPAGQKISYEKSLLLVSASQASVGSDLTLHFYLRDDDDKAYVSTVPSIAIELSGSGTSVGTISALSNNGDGSYTASFTGVTAGTPRDLQALINSKPVTSALPTIEVTSIVSTNTAPVAADQSFSVNDGHTASVTLVASDANNDTLTYSVVTNPTHGTLTGTAPNLIYHSTSPYNGADSFTFKANDGKLDSNAALVSITVNHINDAPNTPAAVTCVTSPVGGSTLNTCTLTAASPLDLDNDAVTYVNAASTCASVVVNATTGATTFTAPAKNATCLVKVKAYDGALYSGITTSATITGGNNPPAATAQSKLVIYETATAITLHGTDIDSDSLTYAVVASPAHGILSGTAPNLTYTPASGYSGADSFTFTANDGTATSSAATVTISVTGPPLYFYSNGTPDNHWATATNWWLNSAHTNPAGRIPTDGDAVYIVSGSNGFDDVAPATSLSLYTGDAPLAPGQFETSNLSIVAGGVLSVTNGWWYGTSDASATVTFSGHSHATGTINGDATFNDSSELYASNVFGNATFNGSSDIDGGGTVSGNAIFNDSSLVGTGTVTGSAVFNNTSSICSGCTLTGSATFNDSAHNDGIVTGDAIFNDSSYNMWVVDGNATFNDSSYNSGSLPAEIFGNATFNDSSYNAGIVDGDATFNDTSDNSDGTTTGTVNGTIHWGAGNPNGPIATGNIYFCDQGSGLWSTAANWFADSGCSAHAKRIPADGDSVTIQSGTFTDVAPATALLSLIGDLTTNDSSETANLSIAASGTLSISNGYWSGTSDATSTVTFSGSGINVGTISGDATFTDSSINSGPVLGNASFSVSAYNESIVSGDATFSGWCINYGGGTVSGNATFSDNGDNQGTVLGNATFNDSSQMSAGTVGGNATFNDSSLSDGTGEVLGNAFFNDSSINYRPVDGSATFTGNSINSDTIAGDATFNDSSYNIGTVNGNAIFNDASQNGYITPGYVLGNATFNDSSHNENGEISGNATFTGTSYNADIVDGDATFADSSYNQYRILGNATFNDNSYNDSIHNTGEISGNATFNDSSYYASIVDGDATFNDTSDNSDGTTTGTVSGTITWGAGNPNAPLAANSTIYFCDQGDAQWATNGNWFKNIGCSILAKRVPADGDSVIIQSGNFSDQPAAISLAGYSGAGPNDGNGSQTSNITISSGGLLDCTAGAWGGTTTNGTVTSTFEGGCANFGTVNGNATFKDPSNQQTQNVGTVTGNATFSGFSANHGTVNGNAIFNGDSDNSNGTVLGNATFNGSLTNPGTVGGTTIWGIHNPNNPGYVPLTVTITLAPGQSATTNQLPVSFVVTFAWAIDPSTFAASDIAQSGTAQWITWTLADSGDHQNFSLTGDSGFPGTLVPSLAANLVSDSDGVFNQPSSSDPTVTYTLCDNAVAFDGGNGSSLTPYLISTVAQLQNLRCHTSSNFQLTSDINLTGQTFPPLPQFTGTFDGNNHVIANFSANYSALGQIGFFTVINGGQILNLSLSNVNVAGQYDVGGLVGRIENSGAIQNCSVSGAVSGTNGSIGGLAGSSRSASVITRSHSSVSVTGSGEAVGGLVGFNFSASIGNSYASGAVGASGGNTYQIGGLVGMNFWSASVTQSYATGLVTLAQGAYHAGGLSGENASTSNSYWDIETTQQSASFGGTGKTTAQMQTPSTFSGWDTNIWNLVQGQYPTLK